MTAVHPMPHSDTSTCPCLCSPVMPSSVVRRPSDRAACCQHPPNCRWVAGRASWLCGGKGLRSRSMHLSLRKKHCSKKYFRKTMSQNVALKPSVQVKISDAICGETQSYLSPVAQWGGRTSDDTVMRGHSLGTTCGEWKGWQPHA